MPNKPELATNRARFLSTSSVPSRLTPSPLDMTYEHVHALGWSSSGRSSLSSRSLRRVEGEDDMTRSPRPPRERPEGSGHPRLGLGLGYGRRGDERRSGPGHRVAPRVAGESVATLREAFDTRRVCVLQRDF